MGRQPLSSARNSHPIDKSAKRTSEYETGLEEEIQVITRRVYQCVCCGKRSVEHPETFYRNPASTLFRGWQHYIPVCKDCINKIFQETLEQYGSRVIAMQTVCHVMDLPYIGSLFDEIRNKTPEVIIRNYLSKMGKLPTKRRAKTFTETIAIEPEELTSERVEERRSTEQKWDDKSKHNKGYVIDAIGYDPFDDPSLESNDRKFLFNTMAGYCPDSSVANDSHKIQSIINIVYAQLQVRKLTELINRELRKPPDQIKNADLARLNDMKKAQLASIDKMAKENEISASATSASKGSNTLSDRMRRIAQEGYRGIEVNLYDVKTCEAMQQVADISMNAIVKELQLQDNDYSDIIKEQRERVTELESQCDELKEENRKLHNKLAAIEKAEKEAVELLEEG